MATVLDSTLLQSIRTLLKEEDAIATLEMKINYVKPAGGGVSTSAARVG